MFLDSFRFLAFSRFTHTIVFFFEVVKTALVVNRSKKAGGRTSCNPQEATRVERASQPTVVLSSTPISGPVLLPFLTLPN